MTDDLDRALLADLRRVVEAAEPIPWDSTAMAHSALEWRSLDAELARLVHDSAVDAAELVVRGGEGARLLAFATDEIRIDVEYAGGQIVGQVVPPDDVVVELHRNDQPVRTTRTDEFGAFVLTDVPGGAAALVCRAGDGSWSVRTSWTSL